MATFAIKVGPTLVAAPQTTFANQTDAMNYARAYAVANNLFPVIIGTNLSNFQWKFTNA